MRENLRESNLISSAIETEISVVLDQPIKDNAAISRLQQVRKRAEYCSIPSYFVLNFQSADDLKFLLYNTVVSPWSQVVWVAGIVLAIVFLLIGLNYGYDVVQELHSCCTRCNSLAVKVGLKKFHSGD